MNSFCCIAESDRAAASCTHRCSTAASWGLLNFVDTMVASFGSRALTAANKRFFDGAARRAGESINDCKRLSTCVSSFGSRTDMVLRRNPRFFSNRLASWAPERTGGCEFELAVDVDML